MDSDGLTLAFSLSALRRAADPAAVVADARTWSANVVVVTDRPPHALSTFQREHGIQQDFAPEPAPAAESLDHVREHFATERYVFVGTEDCAPAGWEFLDVTDAADDAGWELRSPPSRETRVDTSTDDWS